MYGPITSSSAPTITYLSGQSSASYAAGLAKGGYEKPQTVAGIGGGAFSSSFSSSSIVNGKSVTTAETQLVVLAGTIVFTIQSTASLAKVEALAKKVVPLV